MLTGSDPYWATVRPPTPAAVAVVPALVAEAVPVGLDELALAELVEPVGAGGVTGAGAPPPGWARLVSLKLVAVSPAGVTVTV